MPRSTTARTQDNQPSGANSSIREKGTTPDNAEFAADDLAAASEFARSVGGIDKALDLLEHLNGAKDAAPMHREGL